MGEQSQGGMPQDFGRYRFISVVGSGASGAVYQVEDKLLGRPAAMKVGMPDSGNSGLERFRVEARVLEQLHHPNIAGAYEVGTLPDGRPFLVTEWVEGSSLAQLILSGARFSIREVLLLARAVARALGHAHGKKILHLDVKPENILVPRRPDGEVLLEEAKLIDFGVVGRLEGDTGLTRAGMVVGTPYYMSPEQVRGEALTPAADIFALGVVIYKLLSGLHPFEGSGAQDLFFALLNKEPKPLAPSIPPQVAHLVLRCLAKVPANRPRSGSEMTAAIEELLHALMLDAPTTALAQARSTFAVAEPKDRAFTAAAAVLAPAPVPVPPPAPLPPRASVRTPIALGVTIVMGASVVLLATRTRLMAEWWLIAFGAFLVVAGLATGIAVRRYLALRRDQLTDDMSAVLKGSKSRKALSMTLAIQVDAIVKKCQMMDERFLGLTMALMVKEYDSARSFDDKQKALMNAIAILDKLRPKLSPWYVRHEKLIATGVSLVGVVSGLVTVTQNVAKLLNGKP
jgi:serine/threonine-protein kinase